MEPLEDASQALPASRPTVLRSLFILGGLTLLMLLAVARILTPSETGLGTHQQLGLPPCTMRVMFGIRCPGCGMTTAWSHFTRGQWNHSMNSNFAGFCLAFLALLAGPLLIRSGWIDRSPSPRVQTFLVLALVAIMGFAVVEWLFRLLA